LSEPETPQEWSSWVFAVWSLFQGSVTYCL